MAIDDFLDGESAIVAGLTAAVFSPQVRRVVRRGAVLGLAGMMTAGEAVAGVARSTAREARDARANGGGAGTATPDAPARRSGRTTRAEA